MKKITLLCTLLMACLSWQGYAQTTPICGGKFYDTGGATGDFQNNENYTVTILPNVTGNLVTATFTFVDNTSSDDLKVDIGDGNGFVLVPYDIDPANDPPASYTSAAADGSLVFEFISSSVVPNAGWEADITCNPPPTCLQPIALTATNILSTSADLGWTDANATPPPSWDVHVVPAGDPAPTGTTTATDPGVNTNPYSKTTGLSPITDYEFYVRANCGVTDGLSLWSGPFAFTTACGTFPLPFAETFDDADTPSCWTESGDNSWDFSTGAGYAATNVLDHTPGGTTDYAWMDGSDNGSGDISTLTSAAVDISTLTTPALKFYLFSDNTDDAAINIIDVEFYDGAAWNNVLNVSTLLGSNWVKYLIDLSTYTITGDVQVRFTVTGSSTGSAYYNDILIDDVSFLELPTCLQPTALTATNILTTSADLGWTDANATPPPSWDVHVVPAGDPAPTATTTPTDAGITTNPYNKTTGLVPSTTYEFYVRAVCAPGDLSIWSGPYAFVTDCAPFTVPFSENFNTTPIGSTSTQTTPLCWSFIDSGSGYGYVATTGDISFRMYNSSDTTGDYILVSPEITNISSGNNQVSFDVDGSSGQDLIVGTMSDPLDATTFTTITTIALTSSDYETHSITVPTGTDSYVAFKHGQNATYDSYYLDNIYFEDLSCLKPENLSVTNTSPNSADLGWTSTASTWDVEIVAAGTPATGTPTDAGITSNPFTKTGLLPGTNYEFYVRSDCGAGVFSLWTGPFSFITPCLAKTAPWLDDLSAHTPATSIAFSNCWIATPSTGYSWNVGDDDTPSSSTGPSAAHSGLNFFYVEASNGSPGDVVELYTPLMDISALSIPSLQFYYHMYGSTMGELHVDIYDGTSWNNDAAIIIGEQQTADTDPWLQKIIDLSSYSGTIQVRFRAIRGSSYYGDISLDDIEFKEGPSCFAPTLLTATTSTTTSADLSWTSSASSWDIYVVPAVDPAPTGTTTPTASGVTNPYQATGLIPNTDYKYYVRADCTGSKSAWAGPINFYTGYCISVPTSFDNNGITNVVLGSSSFNLQNTNEYQDYTGTPTNLSQSVLANLQITFETGYTYDTHVWIDFNDDFIFDASEMVYTGQSLSANPTTLDASFLMPSTAPLGNHRMRIGTADSGQSTPNPCYNGSYGVTVDLTVNILAPPSCIPPTSLTATNILATSADLGWTSTATTWDVHVVPAGDPAPTSTTTLTDPQITTNPYNKTTLIANTDYEFYVRSDCGNGLLSSWSGPFSFDTKYCSSVPTGFDNNGITNIVLGNTSFNSQNANAYQDYTAAPVSLPQSVQANLQITFETGYTYDTNVWIDFNDDLIFDTSEMVYTGQSLNTNPTTLNASFLMPSTAPLGNHRMRIGTADSGQSTPNPCYSGSYGVTADFTLNILVPPSCIPPTALTAANILTTSADLGWTSTATTWDVHVVLAGDPAPTSTTTATDPGVTTNPYSKTTGLNPSTAYDFYVRADCGTTNGKSAWSGPFTFTTLCGGAVALPYSESFSGGTFPNCWTRSSTTDVVIEATCGTRTNVLRFDYSEQAITGPIDASTATYLEVSYYIADSVCGDIADSGEKFHVDYWDGTQWINAKIYDAGRPDAYTLEIFYVPQSALSNDFKVRFDQIDGSTDSWFIDDFMVQQGPCKEPSNIQFPTITQTTADVIWTENGFAPEWEIEYGPAGFTQGSPAGTVVTDNDGTLGETLTALNSGTVYDVYVRSLCSSGLNSAWIGPATFTTGCATLTSFPLTESFEATSGTRACWTNEYVSGDEDWDYVAANQNGSITPKTGALMAGFSTTNPTGDVARLVSPALDLSNIANPQLKFYFANVGWLGDIDELRIYYRTSATDTWTQFGSDYVTEHTAWTEVVLNLPNPSAEYYIAFEGTSNYGRGVNLDDVWIGQATCPDPSAITVTSILDTSADVSWTENGTATEWEIEYGLNGFAPGTGVGTIVTDNDGTLGETLTGLTSKTSYDVYVTAICGTETSGQIGPKTFTTDQTGVEDQVFDGFTYYPNPSQGRLSLKATSEIQEVIIYDLLGQKVLNIHPDSMTPTLELDNLQSGAYLMKVTINGSVGTFRIIKE